jgi:DNA polymerase-3 subunit alpha
MLNPSQRILVLDTETTGLVPRNVPYTLTKAWRVCRIVQIAWNIYSGTGELISSHCFILRPDGYEIPVESSRIHGITQEEAIANGRPIQEVLTEFYQALQMVDVLVAHNMAFDKPAILSELYRYQMTEAIQKMEQLPTECTMLMGTLPKQKWPKLVELYQRCFNEVPTISHRADADVDQCARIYFYMKQNA